MSLTHILGFAALALLLGLLRRESLRGWVLMGACVIAIYWLQPSTPIRHLDFWLPTASLALTVLVWTATLPSFPIDWKPTLFAGGLIAALLLAIGFTRYFGLYNIILPSRPPDILLIAISLGGVATLAIYSLRLAPRRSWLAGALEILILGAFIVLKAAPLSQALAAWLRGVSGQSAALASPFDIRWLGFSYLAFRLLHVLFDRAAGRLPDVSLREFVIYALFFPAYTAGPIDRIQHFTPGLRPLAGLTSSGFLSGGQRLVVGIFKKFILADTLAILALNDLNAGQVQSAFWMWLLLYCYAFRIFFDFSGYTDIAIGLGLLVGIRLPENFDAPYLKPNLTSFWNSWHMTLAQWFRAYFFNPLTRALRSRPISATLVIFIGQVSTMLLIGLWHGITWNFVAWGLWHGIGLFVHNRWSGLARARFTALQYRPRLLRLSGAAGILITFNYVALGWVWFELPSMGLSIQVFRKLFGG
jgi:alginate O-acetyltransferase complex protein AlgI